MSQLQCLHQNICGGCSLLEQPIDLQRQTKIQRLRALFPKEIVPEELEIHILEGPFLHFRDRCDLTIDNGKIGFYDRHREIFQMKKCEILSPALHALFENFSQSLPEIKKGSVRLRTGIDSEKGLWLDFSNIDIKNLLTEQNWLRSLLDKGFEIEIGQKRKRLAPQGDILKLQAPQTKKWFSTLDFKTLTEIPLNCFVSSFTQPSRSWNQIINRALATHLSNSASLKWLEIGSGIGNFTLPLLTRGDHVTGIESDSMSVQCLLENAHGFKALDIIVKDFNKATLTDDFDAVLLDPPRSGLGDFARRLAQNFRAPQLFYVSCDLDSWSKDYSTLKTEYDLEALYLADQFPHTPRMELLSVFRRRNSKKFH